MRFEEEKHLIECLNIFNCAAEKGEVLFKPMDSNIFKETFCVSEYNSEGVVMLGENGEVAGFAFGCVNGIRGYISYIGVKEEYRHRGIGTRVFKELYKSLSDNNPQIVSVDCMFYNPCSLPWFIPNHAPHDHAGVPGVHMDSVGYEFFKKLGFEDYSIQRAYYLDFENENKYSRLLCRKEKLKEKNIEICYYDKEKHFGFSELFDNIKNEGWRKGVMSRLDEKIVVAVKDGRIIGYTGPLSLSKEKRGMFCGVAVHTDFRGEGIGKPLFAELCAGLKDMGAEFMSLFTGDDNTARFVYESCGFSLVCKFSCMRKPL